MLEVSSSPIQNKNKSFSEIIIAVTLGQKIHKLEWKDKEYYGFLQDATLKLHKPDGKVYTWIVSEGDILGNDWIIVD